MGFDHVDREYQKPKVVEELLTGNEVMMEMDKYFETAGNLRLQPIMHDLYRKTKTVPSVVLRTLKLEEISNGRTDERAWIRYRRV